MLTRVAAVAFVFLALIVVAVAGSQPPSLWSERREQGASIEGHWYPERSGGCFADTAVYRFEADREVIITKGIAVTSGSKLVTMLADGKVALEMVLPLPRTSPETSREFAPARLQYRDLGSKLEMTYFEQKGLPADPDQLGVGNLYRCGEYSLWSRVSLLWRPAFVPGQADEVKDPRRE